MCPIIYLSVSWLRDAASFLGTNPGVKSHKFQTSALNCQEWSELAVSFGGVRYSWGLVLKLGGAFALT
jgi:hypothetical protein